jgi:large subunit ribosomal protein L28
MIRAVIDQSRAFDDLIQEIASLTGSGSAASEEGDVLGAWGAAQAEQATWYHWSQGKSACSSVIERLKVMSRVCQLTGKSANNGMAVSHSHVRTKKLQQVNLQERRLWWAEGNRFVKLRVSTRALKTIQKKGLGVYARELGINLARI